MRNQSLLAVSFVSISMLSSCGPVIPDGIAEHLKEQGETQDDVSRALEGRYRLDRSKCNTEPALCVGGVYALIAKKGTKCSDENFEPLRLFQYRLSTEQKCQARMLHEDHPIRSLKVTGRFNLDISYIIGSTTTDAETALDIRIAEPISAIQDHPDECYEATRTALANKPPYDRTCKLLYFAEITVLSTTAKAFHKQQLKSANSYASIFKLNGEYYSETDWKRDYTVILGAQAQEINETYISDRQTTFLRLRTAGDHYVPPRKLSPAEFQSLKLDDRTASVLRSLPLPETTEPAGQQSNQ